MQSPDMFSDSIIEETPNALPKVPRISKNNFVPETPRPRISSNYVPETPVTADINFVPETYFST